MTSAPPNITIFFSPYAGIWLHAFPEALVAAQILRANRSIVYVTCDGIFAAGCVVMSSYGISHGAGKKIREKICVKCRRNRDLLVKHLGVQEVRMEALVDERSVAAIEETIRSITPQGIFGFEQEGLPLGRYALHETVIHFKLSDVSELTPVAFDDFKRCLSHVLMTVHAAKELLNRFHPEQFVLYNTHISNNYALMNLAKAHGVRTYGLHAGGNIAKRLSSLYVFKQDMVVLYRLMIELFDSSLAALPSDRPGINDAASHFRGLASGRSIFVYSSPKETKAFDVRRFFGIRRDQKVLLATLSSYDELYSSQVMGVMDAHPLMFSDQVEWLNKLIAWARDREELFLLIRVHPRELPNKRDPLHSNHARRLAAAFESLPSNVRINWPTDKVSLYDLATEVAVGLNGWSSAGKELSLLGIPVVLFTDKILYYPGSLNILAKDEQDYFVCIESALASGWSYKTMRRVFRWLTVEYTLSTISISDGFKRQERVRRPFLFRLLGRARWVIDPLYAERAELPSLQRPLQYGAAFVKAIIEDIPVISINAAERTLITEDEEKIAIRQEIGDILATVYRTSSLDSALLAKLRAFADTGDETGVALVPGRVP